MLRACLFFAIATVVVLAALHQLGINIGPLLAGASILGVALGFGSQKLVQDFITGIFLLMENAIQVGDFITVANVSGSVEYLSVRTVRLRAPDGSLHVVPFSSVSTVTNTNRGLGNAAVRVSVKADSDVEEVFAAIRAVGEEMRADPQLKDLILADLEIWGVDQVDGAMITVLGQIRTVDRGRWPVQRAFNWRILERFRELNIQFVNPQERRLVAQPGPSASAPRRSCSPNCSRSRTAGRRLSFRRIGKQPCVRTPLPCLHAYTPVGGLRKTPLQGDHHETIIRTNSRFRRGSSEPAGARRDFRNDWRCWRPPQPLRWQESAKTALMPRLSTPPATSSGATRPRVRTSHLIPKRFTPGFEKRLSGKSLAAVFVALAAGLAARDMMQAAKARRDPA